MKKHLKHYRYISNLSIVFVIIAFIVFPSGVLWLWKIPNAMTEWWYVKFMKTFFTRVECTPNSDQHFKAKIVRAVIGLLQKPSFRLLLLLLLLLLLSSSSSSSLFWKYAHWLTYSVLLVFVSQELILYTISMFFFLLVYYMFKEFLIPTSTSRQLDELFGTFIAAAVF